MQISEAGCSYWTCEWCHPTFARETYWPLMCGMNFATWRPSCAACAAEWQVGVECAGPILLHPIHTLAWRDGDYLRHSRHTP